MADPTFNKAALQAKSVARSTLVTGGKIATYKALQGSKIGIGTPIKDLPEAISYLGTPVHDSVIFGNIGDKSRNNYKDQFGEIISFDPIVINEVLLTVQLTKNIVSTSVPGRNGDVKQYMSRGDYAITLSGKISGKYDKNFNQYLATRSISEFQNTIKLLISICNIGYTLPITSRFLQFFDINNVVITDYTMPQREGMRNSQSFNINMISDEPDTLIFTEEEIDDDNLLSNILPSA